MRYYTYDIVVKNRVISESELTNEEKKMKDIITFKEILRKCEILGKSFKKYLKDTKHNWVILENGESVLRFSDGEYVVYGSKAGAVDDAMKGDKIVREDKFLKECFKYWQVEKDGEVIEDFWDED